MNEKGGFVLRAGAAIIDGLILIIPSALVGALIPFIGQMVVQWAYFILLTLKWDGQTIGKKLFNLKVGDEKGNIPTTGKVVIRETIGKLVSGLILCIGFLWVIWDKDKQGLHDKIAGTYVYQTAPVSQGKKVLAWVLITLTILFFLMIPLMFGAMIAAVVSQTGNPQVQELQQLNKELEQVQQELESQNINTNLDTEATPAE